MIVFLRSVWSYVRPYKTRFFLGLFFGVLYALSQVGLLLVARLVPNMLFGTGGDPVVDYINNGHGWVHDHAIHWFPRLLSYANRVPHSEDLLFVGSEPLHSFSDTALFVAICSLPLVMLLRGICNYLNAYLMIWAATRAVADLRTKLFDHLQNLPLRFFHDARTGNLIARVLNDTGMIQTTITYSASSIVKDPVSVVLIVATLLIYQWKLTLISALVFPPCVVPIIIYGQKIRKSAGRVQTHIAELADVMHETFTGNRVVKAYNLEVAVLERFKEAMRRFVSQSMRIVRAQETPGPLIEFFGALGLSMVFVYAKWLAKTQPQPGDMLQFAGSIMLLYPSIKAVSRLQNQLEQARAASARVFELLATPTDVVEPKNPKSLSADGAKIWFESVDFAYGEKPVLQDFNLTVSPGQMVALVGTTGSGKTTVTNLLLRFYDPQRGAVRIGGVDIREVTTRELRGKIAVVTQETILFNDTILYNISLGRPGASRAEIETAARQANAHQFIMDRPQGYETIVGEKGVTLSGGQRQRIAIARAILKNAPILILDEATNSLDAEVERSVQVELEKLMQGRSTICIAHRLSTIQRADCIVVLEQGRIAETGKHAELMQRGGIYRKLYDIQFQG